MQFIGPSIDVPANASRLIAKFSESKQQPEGKLQLATSEEKQFIFNSAFNPSKIIYDKNYCTVDPFHFKLSQEYFETLIPLVKEYKVFIEIGCGQGEFVNYLRVQGLNAFGFDPVLKIPTKFLVDELWTKSIEMDISNCLENDSTLYIMRCVLPHIPDPFKFLDEIFQNNPNGAVLLEFQRREWIEKENVWPQMSHDHVNIFSEIDFENRYKVITSGYFAGDEWVYVLLSPKFEAVPQRAAEIQNFSKFANLFETRKSELAILTNLKRPIAIFGAAGKGIVLGYSLVQAGAMEIIAIDTDRNRQGRYMECSGIRVMKSTTPDLVLPPDILIVVANPNHFLYVSEHYAKYDIACIGRISETTNNL